MAIERSMLRQKHSDFYYKLNDMCQKVFIMNSAGSSRKPFFTVSFERKQQEEKEKLIREYKRQLVKQSRRQAVRNTVNSKNHDSFTAGRSRRVALSVGTLKRETPSYQK